MTVQENLTTIEPVNGPLVGSISVPGDKSISHRAVLFAAMAEGTSRLSGVLDSEDVRSSLGAVSKLGAKVNLEKAPDGSLYGGITGWGAKGPSTPSEPIDCGNSGTTTRLLMGILAPWDIEVELTGDDSLRRRPMRRVSGPLSRMGAKFLPEGQDTLPLTIHGTRNLKALDYDAPVASAQVKTAILLAGLSADGTTRVTEPSPSRNHTELMLPEFGAHTTAASGVAEVVGPTTLKASEVVVPGDPSSAAFIACAAALIPGSAIQIEGVSLNPARIGFCARSNKWASTHRAAACRHRAKNSRASFRCNTATSSMVARFPPIKFRHSSTKFPCSALVAAHAKGITVFRGVDELRVKETDRVAAVIDGLTKIGVDAWADGSDLFIEGDPDLVIPEGVKFETGKDHRLAMTWALAGLSGNCPVQVADFESCAVSYPAFLSDIRSLVRER